MCDWSRWSLQESYGINEDKDETSRLLWNAKSFAHQMAEIGGEVSRVIRRKGKLENIRNHVDYIGEPQVIRHIFEQIRKDPKNLQRLEEIQQAEQMTCAFLAGTVDAPSQEEMLLYWEQYLEAYLEELEV